MFDKVADRWSFQNEVDTEGNLKHFCWQNYSSEVPKSLPDKAVIQRLLVELVIPAKPVLFFGRHVSQGGLGESEEALAAKSVFQPESILH